MVMKLFLSMICLLVFCKTQAQIGFGINGTLENAEGLKVYLEKQKNALSSSGGIIILDSTLIRNKTFRFQGQLNEPEYYSIHIEDKRGWKSFLLENKVYHISGNGDMIWAAKMEGSEEIKLGEEHASLIRPLIEQLNAASDSSTLMYAIGDTLRSREFGELNQFFWKQISVAERDFMLKYPDAYTSLFLFRKLEVAFDKNEQRQVFEQLSNRIKQHSLAKKIYYELYEADTLIDIGKPAIPFTLQDPYGNWINLSGFKGKYVLLDFWASWCGKCRGDYPFLIELYYRYQLEGFEILSLSADEDLAQWKRAIADDGLPWSNVSDFKNGINEVALKYGIYKLPRNFLLDKNGNIIAMNLQGQALADKLLEIFRR